MKITLGGYLSGNGLTREPISGEMTANYVSVGKVKFWDGGFIALKAHEFSVDEEYRLDLDSGDFHKIVITSVGSGLVKFQTR